MRSFQLLLVSFLLLIADRCAYRLREWRVPRTKSRSFLSMLASESKAAVQFDGWLNRSDNMVLLPSTSKPKAVIHFLGGAFFGSVPHVFYRSFLESLSQQGYIIVATPFRLQMDYMVVCDEVIRHFDKVASELAREYGPLVVIGIGHSFGAVLQTLITSLFPDTPRAINILISFNGRGAVDAVPLYEEVVIPLSKQYELFRNESDNLSPSSTRINRVLSKPFDPFSALFNLAYGVKEQLNAFVTSSSSLNQPQFLSFYQQLTQFIDQIPLLLTEIAEGREEFTPSFQEVKEVCRRMYRARRTLVIQFKQDNLDNSEEITSTLREANTIMRMKRPMVEMDVQLLQLEGTHLTPLALGLQDISLQLPLSTLTSSSSTRDRSSILGSSLKLPLPLRDCEGRDILMNTMKEPLNLNSLLEDINSYLNSNIK